MLLNVITDKKEHCKRFGIDITEEWNCYQMPSVFVTDRGSEYASETMEQFETVLLHCILFYNSKRILEDFPYTEEMLEDSVKPYPNQIWKWYCENGRYNVIEAEKEQLVKVLLPRTNGVFTRSGLQVGKLYYHNPFYMEKYLQKRKESVKYYDTTSL